MEQKSYFDVIPLEIKTKIAKYVVLFLWKDHDEDYKYVMLELRRRTFFMKQDYDLMTKKQINASVPHKFTDLYGTFYWRRKEKEFYKAGKFVYRRKQ